MLIPPGGLTEAAPGTVVHAENEWFAKLADRLAQGRDKGIIRRGGVRLTIPGVISTRSPTLDAAIGRGGIPLGRWTVLTGDEGTGKTTLCLQIAAECQKMGGVVFYEDTENKLDLLYAQQLGVNIDEIIVGNPKHVEEAYEMMADAVEIVREANLEGDRMIPGVVILDSINTTISSIEFDAEFGDKPRPGGHAAAVSRAIAKLNQRIGATPIAILEVSQIRNLIGGTGYGPKTTEISGGRATAFLATLVIRLIRLETLKEGDRPYGQEVKAIIRKSQIAMPFGEAIMQLHWGKGIDYVHGLLTLAVAYGVMNYGVGKWYELPDVDGKTVRWQGEKKFAGVEEKHPGIRALIEERVAEARSRSATPRSTKRAKIKEEAEE